MKTKRLRQKRAVRLLIERHKEMHPHMFTEEYINEVTRLEHFWETVNGKKT
jgi:hypothetical protein